MSRIRIVALTGLVLVGALAFAACGGGDDKDKDDGGKTPSATSSSGDGKTVEAEPTKENGDGGTSSDDSKELQKVADKFKDAKFQAVYEISGGDPTSPFGAGGKITIYKNGEDKLRFDIKTEQDGEPFEGSFIQNGVDSYICFSGAQATTLLGDGGGEGACLKSSADDPTNPVGDLSDTFGDLDVGNVEIQDKSHKKIAGEDATCYKVLDKDTDEVSTACFSDDGVLLAIESADTTFEATSVGKNVSARDFEPAYEIVVIPTVAPPDVSSTEQKLALISGVCTPDASIGYITCEGFVENISSSTLEDVEVVVDFYADDVPVSSESALIDYDVLLPGQQSAWSVIATYNPRYTKNAISFREFLGSRISTRDDR